MYPAGRDMDAVHSGTGVFYQAMPAVAADGKNIMKLIPVQLVNGQFVQHQMNKARLDSFQQTGVNTPPAPVRRKTAVSPPAARQMKTKQVTFVNIAPHPAASDPRSSQNDHPPQQQASGLMSKVPLTATDRGSSIGVPAQLPVTVKSPALPRGHYLQIPADAQVRTLPTSALPAGIKKQIFSLSPDSASGSGAPDALYVSPVTTVNQGAAPQCDSALHSHKSFPKSATRTPVGPATAAGTKKARLKLIAKASQRPNSPIKWVIEEEDGSAARNLHPVTSHGPHTVAGKENGRLRCDVSESNQHKSGQGQDNALIMCNGKVFFVGKKCSLPPRNGESDSHETAERAGPAAPPTREGTSILIQDEPDEVIDLCGDDAWDVPPQHEASVRLSAASHQEDDNVIFVSYIPPASEAGAPGGVTVRTQRTREEGRDGTPGASSSHSATEESADDEDIGSALTGRRPDTIDTVPPPVCGPEVTDVRHTEGSDVGRPAEGAGAEAAAGSRADRSGGSSDDGGRSSSAARALELEGSPCPAPCRTSPPAPRPRDVADPQLRRAFGITADVRIRLQRVDGASARESKSSAEEDREPENRSEDREDDACGSSIGADRVTELEASPEATPLKYAPLEPNTKPLPKCHSGQSSLKAAADVEETPVIGYVEPIDEDFLSDAEDAAPQSPTRCTDLNTNRRRLGRTRKRPTCPCCVPGNLPPAAVKPSARWEEPERWACRTERTSRRGTRTKAARKDGTSRSVCPMAEEAEV